MLDPVRAQPEGDSDSDEILQLLQNVLDEQPEKSPPITRETRIDRYFIEARGDDEIEYLQLSFDVELAFGIQLSNEDWKFLGGGGLCESTEEWEVKYAHMFTFGRLADLIAGRMKLGSLEPATVFGTTSLAAGAFRRLQVLAKRVDANVEEFAPSTKILDRFRGSKLREFWGILRAVSGNRVPPLEDRSIVSRVLAPLWGSPGVAFWIIASIAVPWIASSVFGPSSLGSGAEWVINCLVLSMVLAMVLAFLLLPITLILRLIGHFVGPRGPTLPRGIETFRDVSLLIAGDRGGWCRQCGYDLTGLDGRRCPECGTPQKEIKIPTASQLVNARQAPGPAPTQRK